MNMNRRNFLKTVGLGLVGAAAGAYYYSTSIEPHWLEFVHRPLPVANLPGSLIGKKLVQISDIHVGPDVSDAYLVDAFEQVQALDADIVVFTGDFISYYSQRRMVQLSEIMAFAPRGRLGTAAILGNHDYGRHWRQASVGDEIAGFLTGIGIPTLRNDMLALDGLTLIGIDDIWSPNAFPRLALRGYEPAMAAIALCHNPDGADLPFWGSYRGWILSGHTHGGQLRPPFLPPPFVPVNNKRYTAGEFDLFDGRRLYINRGLGHKVQLRFNARPEVTIFSLQRS